MSAYNQELINKAHDKMKKITKREGRLSLEAVLIVITGIVAIILSQVLVVLAAGGIDLILN